MDVDLRVSRGMPLGSMSCIYTVCIEHRNHVQHLARGNLVHATNLWGLSLIYRGCPRVVWLELKCVVPAQPQRLDCLAPQVPNVITDYSAQAVFWITDLWPKQRMNWARVAGAARNLGPWGGDWNLAGAGVRGAWGRWAWPSCGTGPSATRPTSRGTCQVTPAAGTHRAAHAK